MLSKTRLVQFVFISLVILITATIPARSQNRPSPQIEKPELYFLAIGSQDYLYSDARYPENGFDKLYSPERSARRVSEALIRNGAKYGMLLNSSAADAPGKKAITRGDVFSAIIRLKQRIRADKARNPRILIYIMGHGIGETTSGYQFFIPGNLGFSAQPTQTSVARLMNAAVWSTDIVSSLVFFRNHFSMKHFDEFFVSAVTVDPTDLFGSMQRVQKAQRRLDEADRINRREGNYLPEGNAPVPFIALFDNCFGGVGNDLVDIRAFDGFINPMLSDFASDGLVMFATRPGTTAAPVFDPTIDDYHPAFPDIQQIGPLAARLLNVLDTRPSEPLKLGWIEEKMMAQLPQNWTNGAPTPARPFKRSDMLSDVARVHFFPQSGNPSGHYDVIHGSGDALEYCCQ